MSYAQDVLSSIWNKLMESAEQGQDDSLDVSDLVSSFLCAKALTNEDREQTLELRTVVSYSDSDNGGTPALYTRKRPNSEALWGRWESKN